MVRNKKPPREMKATALSAILSACSLSLTLFVAPVKALAQTENTSNGASASAQTASSPEAISADGKAKKKGKKKKEKEANKEDKENKESTKEDEKKSKDKKKSEKEKEEKAEVQEPPKPRVFAFSINETPFGAQTNVKAKENKVGAGSESLTVDTGAAALKLQIAPALKTLPANNSPEQKADLEPAMESSPLSLGNSQGFAAHTSIASRLLQARLYLPGRLVLGKSSEFIVKGKPFSRAAIAMADKNTGAKPIYSHSLRLGADRKVVAVGEIPESGVLKLDVDCPVEFDMVGEHLFFEAAVWRRPDFSDMEIAIPVPSEEKPEFVNGVSIAGISQPIKKGIKFGNEERSPLLLKEKPGSMGLDVQ